MTERHRILMLVSGLAIGQQAGGADRFGLELARHLDPGRFEVVLCAFWERGEAVEAHWIDQLRRAGVHAFFAVERGAGFSYQRFARGLENIRQVVGACEVIHSNFQLGSISALLLRRSLGARALVRTAHGAIPHEWTNGPMGRLSRALFTRVLFAVFIDQEAGVSQAVADSLNKRRITLLTRRPALMIPNAIPTPEQPAVGPMEKRAELGQSQAGLLIGVVGRLSEQKGHRFLLEAAPAILSRYPQCRFLLVGDGEWRDRCERQVRDLGLEGAVVFLGTRSDVNEILPALDLFVLPSLWEGLPTVVLEAMWHGVPVVATDIPGTRDLVIPGRTGWLAPPADAAALSTVICETLSHPALRAEFADRAAREIVPRYTMARIAGEYAKLYERLIRERP